MSIKRIIGAVFNIKKWPNYGVDLYIKFIKQNTWRKRGISIGENTIWMGLPIITNKGSVSIGRNCLIVSRVENTALGVNHKTIIRAQTKDSKINIGNGVRMSGTTICCNTNITIGERCVIGADVIIADTDFHSLDPIERGSIHDSNQAINKSVDIGNDVFIGGRSIILKGVTLGDNVVVGAGSVVTKSFDENSIVAGNPAKKIGEL